MYGRGSHDKLTDSNDWREEIGLHSHRYMREDIEYGLAFLVSVADWLRVPVPVASGLLALGSAVVGSDFRNKGPRTLESLGLAGLLRGQMADLLEQGLA
jgi:opine dehydrogenase